MSEIPERLRAQFRQSIVKWVSQDTGDDTVEEVIAIMWQQGARSLQDLAYIKAEALVPLLTPVQANKLITNWQNIKDSDINRPSSSRGSGVHFNYSVIPRSILRQLEAGKTLNAKDMRLLKTTVVMEVKATVPNLQRSYFKPLGEAMLNKYSKLEALIGKDNKVKPYEFVKALKDKFDNTNRDKEEKTQNEVEAPALPEAYGCIKWQLQEIPPNETTESLQRKQEELKDMYVNVYKKDWEWQEEILPRMKATYGFQRRDINSQTGAKKKKNKENELAKTTTEIQGEWPFLFTPKGMSQHFAVLTGVLFEDKLRQFMEDPDLPLLLDFLAEYKGGTRIKKAMERALQRGNPPQETKLLAFVMLLMSALKEDQIIFVVEETTRLTELTELVDVPGTPSIFAPGLSAFRAKTFFVCVDGQPRMTVKKFSWALLVLFEMYFVLNIKYSLEAPSTLDYIQRNIADINPGRGSKVPSSVKGKGPVQRCLSRFQQRFAEFKEAAIELDNSEAEDDVGPA